MKKLLIMFVATSMMAGINAQEAAEKKVLAGLTLGTGLNFNNPQTTAISPMGVGFDFVAGMSLDWHFAKNIGLSTGIEFDFNRFSHKFEDPAYFDYNDKEIVQRGNESDEGFDNPPEGVFELESRRYRNIYLTIPTMLRFQTNYMGYLRYFGKFGVRNSFLLSTRTDNEGSDLGSSESELEDMRNPGDLSIYKGSVGLSVGAEWNFSGSTCIVGEIGYYYGFTEIHKQKALTGDDAKNRSIYDNPLLPKAQREYYTPAAKQGQLILKISVLF